MYIPDQAGPSNSWQPLNSLFEPRSRFWAALSLGFYADPNLFHHVIIFVSPFSPKKDANSCYNVGPQTKSLSWGSHNSNFTMVYDTSTYSELGS